jgi:TonB family protein
MNRHLAAAAILFGVLGCGSKPSGTVTLPEEVANSVVRRDEPPVPINANSPAHYPDLLASQRIGGTVLLRLFTDSAGVVVAESTSIQESSGYPALDSAALASVPQLRYAPALRDGIAVAASFLQPFHFRPTGSGTTSP